MADTRIEKFQTAAGSARLPPQIPEVRLLQGQTPCHAHTGGYLLIPDI